MFKNILSKRRRALQQIRSWTHWYRARLWVWPIELVQRRHRRKAVRECMGRLLDPRQQRKEGDGHEV